MLPTTVRAGSTLARYELVRPLGSGGGGTVYEAIDADLDRRVAVKVLHTRAVSPGSGAEAGGAEARFLREGRIAAQIRHPHVVDVFDVGVDEGVSFLVMELVGGETLAQLLARESRLSLAQAVEILLPIASAVAELHANGVVHRDIKPSNILLAGGGAIRPQLTDFGVSSSYGTSGPVETALAEGAILGTPEYLAPEVIRSPERAGERSDQYAIGALLYECVTGHKPFGGATPYAKMRAALHDAIIPPSTRCASLPAALDEVILRAMHRDPEQRFASVSALGERLLAFAEPPVAARWSAEFVVSPAGARARPPPALASIARASSGDDGLASAATASASLVTYDGVAILVRGDAFVMLWSTPARLPRTRWTFDQLDRMVAQRPGGVVAMMIILPTADPPDRLARQENERRIRRVAHDLRRVTTVVVGDGVRQVLVRTVMRAMEVPHRGAWIGPTSVESTVEAGVRQLRKSASLETPSHDRLLEDVRDMHAALGLPRESA
jgi:Protein kinase domain